MKPPHTPVLLEEIKEFFEDEELSIFVDGTLGFGGHARALLQQHPEMKRYIGFDQDQKALLQARENLKDFQKKVTFIHANFDRLDEELQREGVEEVDGFLFDIGISSMQVDEAERGFSFMREGPLDMRMNEEEAMTAEKLVNEFPEKKLGEIFRDLGEEPRWRAVAKAIAIARRKKRIKTTKDLVEVIETVKKKRGKLHPATLIFQAIRIFVNRELEVLESVLEKAAHYLSEEGILGVISFHSLEDRIVKHTFREIAREGPFTVLTKKPIIATREETRKNPRARSAKLRFLQREAV